MARKLSFFAHIRASLVLVVSGAFLVQFDQHYVQTAGWVLLGIGAWLLALSARTYATATERV